MTNNLHAGSMLKNDSYRIGKLLGQGGFGAVYLADDMILEKPCAIKESQDNSPAAQAQFEVEARILANLNHPHLPRVTDNFIDPSTGLQYLVMEYVEGQDLGELLAHSEAKSGSAGLPEEKVRAWIDQVLDALAYLHAHRPRPIIHRDVKPDNIRLQPDGVTVKLVDFGIAKLGGVSDATRHGARGATPGFSPPEQYGTGTGPTSDVYAIGATLYNLLTGVMPPDAIDRAYAKAPLHPPRQLNPLISETMEETILTAMQLDPALRFPDAREMRLALQGSRPAVVLSACPHCGKPVRPDAKFCPSCGKKISTIKPFLFNKSGARANDLSELVHSADDHWEEALEYFQRGEIDRWLNGLGPDGQKLARQGQTLRARYSDPSAAMEAFLKAASPTRPVPVLSVQPPSLDFGEVRLGKDKTLSLVVSNSGRGYLYGSLAARQGWIEVQPAEFGCRAGMTQRSEVRSRTSGLSVTGEGMEYSGEIVVESNGGQQKITLKLKLAEEAHPAVDKTRVVSREAQPSPGTRFFLDPSLPGTGVSDLTALVRLCDQDWGAGVSWLLTQRIEELLGNLHMEGLRQIAEKARQSADPNAGLERLLRAAGAQPPIHYATNLRQVRAQLGYGLFPKSGAQPKVVALSLTNTSPRGYLHGQVKPIAAWLGAPKPEFGCLPGQTARIELHVNRATKKADGLSLRKALFDLVLL